MRTTQSAKVQPTGLQPWGTAHWGERNIYQSQDPTYTREEPTKPSGQLATFSPEGYHTYHLSL
jgi:hypothetical protein